MTRKLNQKRLQAESSGFGPEPDATGRKTQKHRPHSELPIFFRRSLPIDIVR